MFDVASNHMKTIKSATYIHLKFCESAAVTSKHSKSVLPKAAVRAIVNTAFYTIKGRGNQGVKQELVGCRVIKISQGHPTR